jgi:hypothetical protein
MRRFIRLIVGVLAALLLAASCSGADPEILQVYWQLNVVEDLRLGATYERLSVFVHADDADGIDDLDKLYLIRDEDRLYWELETGSWNTRSLREELWLGTNGMVMPAGDPVPRGNYRVLMVDAAGDRDETELYVNTRSIDPDTLSIPSLKVSGQAISVDTAHTSTAVWAFDQQGNLLYSPPVAPGPTTLSRLLPNVAHRNAAASLHIVAYDNSLGVGLISGPYPVQ